MSSQPSPVTFHFAHANGFPAGSYRTLFGYLPSDWQCLSIERLGHSPRYPVNKNWQNLVQEVIDNVKRHNVGGGVYAVGHSFGAVVSYMAACQQPELFRGLIMLDPPLVTGPYRHAVRLAKMTPLIDKMTPAGLSKSRNARWPADTDLVAYFAKKGLFKHMDRRCIADYVNAVAERDGDDWVLGFRPEVETAIFRHVPHNLSSFSGKLRCPAVLVTGEHTNVCVPAMRNRFIKANKLEHTRLPGGHMFPLEHPKAVADFLVSQINQWEQAGNA
ncbi:alpha/beta fold hydrolase [Alteromonas sp. CYL-A6]|uniref:alpha/beta fold hydrolase n=1 Tax=Alteromonas nitratireducens TaxID=3390813 RepID=UPI0034C4890D